MSARATGIPKSAHFSPPVPELIPLSEALPMMGIALCCVWAAYTTSELPQVMAPAAASPEVAAHAAEPPEAAVLASAPCIVVAPSNVLSACHVTVKGTIDEHCTCPVTELYLFPDVTTVEPPEVAASAAEPPEVSVVPSYESLSCPVTAMEAICESLSCPVTAMEAIYESSSCPVTAMEAVYESSSCPVTAKEAVYELPGYSVPATKATLEPLPCSEPAEEAISELSLCSELTKVADFELSIRLVSSNVSGVELSVLPVSMKESKLELSVCLNAFVESEFELSVGPDLSSVSDVEPCVCPISNYESVFCPTSPVTTPETLPELSPGSSSLVTAQRPAIELLTLFVMDSETINAHSVCPVSTKEPDYELSVGPFPVTEMSVSPVSLEETL